MKSNDELADHFRQQADQLKEAPSSDAWRKLEGRLDARRSKRERPVRRIYSLAAAVAALVILVSVVALWFPNAGNNSELAMSAQPQEWEDLERDTESDAAAYEVVAVTYRHHNELTQPIKEGSANRRLQVQAVVSSELNHTRTGNRSEVIGPGGEQERSADSIKAGANNI